MVLSVIDLEEICKNPNDYSFLSLGLPQNTWGEHGVFFRNPGQYLSTDQGYEPKWSVFWKHWPGLRQKLKTLTRGVKKNKNTDQGYEK